MSDYYLGLDVGTGSVGWACVDDKYNLLQKNSKNTWGVRLFKTAETNIARRTNRTARRRYARRRQRILWLRDLVADEVNKIDSSFFDRLDLSQIHLNDNVKNTYLKKDLTKTNKNSLFNDENYQDKDYFTDFPTIWHLRSYLCTPDNSKKIDIRHYYLAINHILKHRGHFLFESFTTETFTTDNNLVKSIVNILPQEKYNIIKNKITDKPTNDEEYKNKVNVNQHADEVRNELTKNASKKNIETDELYKITNQQQLLKLIFGGSKKIEEVKLEFSKFDEISDKLEAVLEPEIFEIIKGCYEYSLFLEANRLLKGVDSLEDYYLAKFEENKSRDEKLRKFAFPRQLNGESLDRILKSMPVSDDIKQKIKQIFEFKIPYYIGPLDDRSKNAWVVRKDEENRQNITPWNFEEIVDENGTKTAFYKSLINKCTFLPAEDVLAKDTILNQKYLVLEQINNMKINGVRISQDVKRIFWDAFKKDRQNKTNLKKLLKEYNIPGELKLPTESKKGKEKEIKLHQMSSYINLSEIFDANFIDKNEREIDKFITALAMQVSVDEALDQANITATDEQRERLKKLRFDGWSRYSRKFLSEVKIEADGEIKTIISSLENTEQNIMEILSEFQEEINKENANTLGKYDDILNERWFNPIAKRPIIQTLKIIAELKRTFKQMPKEIFIESTRDLDIDGKNKGKETKSKAQELKEKGLYNGGDFDSISNRKFLYLMQKDQNNISKCIYCLTPLDEKTCEIEHIQPKTKRYSNSLRDNLAVSCHKCNHDVKGDVYPIDLKNFTDNPDATHEYWKWLFNNGRISVEKYSRLKQTTGLDELGFIPQQLTATGMIAVALKQILKLKYPNTKITFVKPGLSKILRPEYSKTEKNEDGEIINKTIIKPEFVKSRVANDFHHAKDAYLAIIAGRVYGYVSGKYRNIGNTYATNFSLTNMFWPSNSAFSQDKIWSEEHFANMVKTMRKNKGTQFCITHQIEYGDGQFWDETVYKSNMNVKKLGDDYKKKLNAEKKEIEEEKKSADDERKKEIDARIEIIKKKIKTIDKPQFERKKGLDPKRYGGYKSGKSFGFLINEGDIKSVLNKDAEIGKKYIGAYMNLLVNNNSNIWITGYNPSNKRVFFDHKKYNFEFSDDQARLIESLDRLFTTQKWSEKIELVKKYNNDECLKLLKWIDAQIGDSVVLEINITEDYTNDLITTLKQLEKRFTYIKLNSGGKDIKNSGGKNINSYINKSQITSLKIKHTSITGLWQTKGQ